MRLEGSSLGSIYLKAIKKQKRLFEGGVKGISIDGKSLALLLLVLLITGFGCLMVYSASFYSAQMHYKNEYFFLFKQIMGVV